MGEGVVVDVVDHDHVRLTDEQTFVQAALQLRRFDRPLSPAKIPTLTVEPGLLVVPRGTSAFFDRARESGWSVVTDDGGIDLKLGDRTIRRHAPALETKAARPGASPWPLFTTARVLAALVEGRPERVEVTQSWLADRVGTSQPTLSRALARLEREGFVDVGRGYLAVPDVEALISWWLAVYPGPGGVSSYWYGLGSVVEQTRSAVALLGQSSDSVAVSGEVAADLLAPWQRPGTVQLYARSVTSLGSAGFVPVASAEEATLIVNAPRDQGIWMPSTWELPSLGRTAVAADPLQVLFDLDIADAPTAREAGAHLVRQLCGPLADSWRTHRIGERL